MKLTNHATILSFSSRENKPEDWLDLGFITGKFDREHLEKFFQKYRNKEVGFWDKDTRESTEGILVNLLPEGVLVIEGIDGKQHEVGPKDILWAG
jgi:hypothetical protein